MGGIRLCVMILLLFLLIYPSGARMGYDIMASAGGSTFELHRSTKYMSFSLDSSVRGSGNFSRLNSISDITGMSSKEATSCTKNGTLNYSEQIRLITKEGPVLVTANLASYNLSELPTNVVFKDSAYITVDEQWPTSLADLKKIAYFGHGIRTRERYDNNGNVVATSMNSWSLSKDSLYRASNNRTIILASITPKEVDVDIAANRTSYYGLNLRTIGELTNLDVIKRGTSGEVANRVTQDYRGTQNMNLVIKMNDLVIKPPVEDHWLECCPSGSMYERLFGNQSI
jgi:hypothetical protein